MAWVGEALDARVGAAGAQGQLDAMAERVREIGIVGLVGRWDSGFRIARWPREDGAAHDATAVKRVGLGAVTRPDLLPPPGGLPSSRDVPPDGLESNAFGAVDVRRSAEREWTAVALERPRPCAADAVDGRVVS